MLYQINFFKRIVICILMLSVCVVSRAQSQELRNAYSNVVKTLNEYRFQSEDVREAGGDFGKSKSITVKLQGGFFIFTFNDSFAPFTDPIHGFRHGVKSIKVSIEDARFEEPRYSSGDYLTISGNNGVEFNFKNKKEILKGYKIGGAELSIKKLLGELNELLSLARDEEFKGTLGGSSASKGSSSKKNNSSKKSKGSTGKKTTPKSSKSKKVGKYVE